MSESVTETAIEELREAVVEAETATAIAADAVALEAEARRAETIVTAETAAITVAAAEAAAALANVQAASAQMEAAVTIQENESELSWLKMEVQSLQSSMTMISAQLSELLTLRPPPAMPDPQMMTDTSETPMAASDSVETDNPEKSADESPANPPPQAAERKKRVRFL
jgi:hypothetical protein